VCKIVMEPYNTFWEEFCQVSAVHSLETQLDWVRKAPINTSCASYGTDWRKIEITSYRYWSADLRRTRIAFRGVRMVPNRRKLICGFCDGLD
jgi:hypothetical protein